MCGFAHSTLVTAPFSVTGLLASNSAANEWCVKTGSTKARARRPAPITTRLMLINAPPALLYTEASGRARCPPSLDRLLTSYGGTGPPSLDVLPRASAGQVRRAVPRRESRPCRALRYPPYNGYSGLPARRTGGRIRTRPDAWRTNGETSDCKWLRAQRWAAAESVSGRRWCPDSSTRQFSTRRPPAARSCRLSSADPRNL